MILLHIIRYRIEIWLLAVTVPLSMAGIANADDAEDTDDAGKRKAAIAAILQAGGDIRVAVHQPTATQLERLSLTEVNLRKAEVDNALLIHVGNLKEVKRLDLSNANIDDDGLEKIAHLPLRELWLQGTNISDASSLTISEIKTLTFLQLNATALTDGFLEHLESMPALEDLGLRGTHITGSGMKYLSRHPKLKTLDVYRTEVDDAGVKYLVDCRSLKDVGLSATKITDQVFEYLAKLPGLTHADLSGNRPITTEAVRAFEKSHPKIRIQGFGNPH